MPPFQIASCTGYTELAARAVEQVLWWQSASGGKAGHGADIARPTLAVWPRAAERAGLLGPPAAGGPLRLLHPLLAALHRPARRQPRPGRRRHRGAGAAAPRLPDPERLAGRPRAGRAADRRGARARRGRPAHRRDAAGLGAPLPPAPLPG